MPFSASWGNLIDRAEDLPPDATLITPLSDKRFTITDVQEHRIVIEFRNGESRPLQREQFESLYQRIQESPNGFPLSNIPTGAEPYAAVWSLHPRYEIDEEAGVITETEGPTTTQLLDAEVDTGEEELEREEPDVAVYSDALLLIDALERHDVTHLPDMETNALVNLYILLSDVQRDANDFRQDIADVLLSRVHHDQPTHGQYGSIQRTSRRRRTLKDEDEVLSTLEAAGINRERVMGVDRDKVDDAIEVTELSESDVYDIEESEYVRKAEVDEEVKETRLQGLKDRLQDTEGKEAEELRQEIEELENRIDELTSFRTGSQYADG